MRRLTVLLNILFVLATDVYSQDKIFKKGGEVIQAKISEIGTTEIKYTLFNETQGPVYLIEKDRVLKIVYQNGRTELYQNDLRDPGLYSNQATRAIKVNFLSPLRGYTQLSYEKSLKPGRAYELSLGIIGLGKRQELDDVTPADEIRYREQKGAFIGGGYKFRRVSDYTSPKDRYSHIMQGAYVKPELLLGTYRQNFRLNQTTGGNAIEKKSVVFSSLLVNLGKQWVMDDRLVIDFYGSFGYAIDNLNEARYEDETNVYYKDDTVDHFAVLTPGRNSGFGFSGGFRIGILIK